MNFLLASLLIVNITVVVAATTVITKEIIKTRNELKENIRMIDNKINLMNSCMKRSNTEELKKEIKEHISKEFMAMAFRGISLNLIGKKLEG